jgi:hypothetical protein
MKGKAKFTSAEIAALEFLIRLRIKTPSSGQKTIRDKMRKIGFYGKDDWGITDMQVSDLNRLITSGRIKVVDGGNVTTPSPKAVTTKPDKPAAKSTISNDFSKVRARLEAARLKYKPTKVKYLLIAEAPPDSFERFFYYDNVHQHDYLFLGVAQALYPNLKDNFLASGRNSAIKNSILLKMKADGFYLLDLSDLPLSLMTGDLSSQLPKLVGKINKVADEHTQIILIKATVFDTTYAYLNQRGFKNVVDIRIPFPGQGGQKNFQIKFNEALKLVEYR